MCFHCRVNCTVYLYTVPLKGYTPVPTKEHSSELVSL